MRILICSLNYAPEITGIGRYTGEMAEWLAARGHEVRVVCAPPYYPEWRVREGYSAWHYAREARCGVEIWRCPLYVPRYPTGMRRLLHLASFALSSFPVMLRQALWKPDLVFVVEPPLFCAPGAWVAARLGGGKCWLHVQDLEVDAAFRLGLLPGWLRSIAGAVERWIMRRFDRVSSISASMCARLREKGIQGVFLFPNWADLERMRFDAEGRRRIRDELGLGEDDFLCLYAGNMAEKQGLEIALEAAACLPDVRFLLCGEGPRKQALMEKAGARGLRNVEFWPLQPEMRLPALLSAADAHLVVQRRDAADLVMPSKLVNIMAVGGAAVVTADEETELGRLSRCNPPCVLRCAPENAQALAEAIRRLREDERLRQALGAAAREYVREHLSREKVLARWEKEAMACLDGF